MMHKTDRYRPDTIDSTALKNVAKSIKCIYNQNR